MNNQPISCPPIPDELSARKAGAKNGEVSRATVRELLSWFGAARRGFQVVQRIRNALDTLGISTFPDFEGEYIDQEIYFVDKNKFTPPKVADPPHDTAGNGAVISMNNGPVDPSHRLGRLKAANRQPVAVVPGDRLESATTLMLTHDFSQLPVMQGDRSVKGIVSWKSIGSRLALGRDCKSVQDCMERHYELLDDASIFDAISVIAAHDCVLVRSRENKVTGLVTAADISEQFHVLAEPFLLLGDIENRIRALIVPKFSREDLQGARNPEDVERVVEDASDLTFGEYVRLLENESRWAKLSLQIDRVKFTDNLKGIRDIRNDVMHFDPDGITEGALDDLRRFSRFLDQLQHLIA